MGLASLADLGLGVGFWGFGFRAVSLGFLPVVGLSGSIGLVQTQMRPRPSGNQRRATGRRIQLGPSLFLGPRIGPYSLF